MIGVIAEDTELVIAREFFQLFKTPWEPYIAGRSYDAVITTRPEVPEDLGAQLVVVYSSMVTAAEGQPEVPIESEQKYSWVEWQGTSFPIYGELAGVRPVGQPLIFRRGTSEPVAAFVYGSKCGCVRVGYDLLREVRFLLSRGQPAHNADIPTLDIHIALLRAIIAWGGVTFVEIPPAPASYDFATCLTHDVDFVGIRDHKFDHTMWGFLYRCFVGSMAGALRRRIPWSRCLQNWAAALSLPLVHLGLRDDFWLEFERYAAIEGEFGSTFFFIPFRNYAGTLGATPAPKRRAAKYDLARIRRHVAELVRKGFEVGLHGIDAWRDSQSARLEQTRITETTGQPVVGTRMHWLYWTDTSPLALDGAGIGYDSTFGYNDAVGFRAGTSQPFRPIGAKRLLELPLNIQDSALFYGDRMRLSEEEGLNACRRLIRSMLLHGGALTVNWHTRSLSPERLWGDFYALLLREIRAHRVWFSTAQEIVGWYRNRRELCFESVELSGKGVRVSLSGPNGPSEPSFAVRVYRPNSVSNDSRLPLPVPESSDIPWDGVGPLEILFEDSPVREASY